jgi:hypothetical protein
MENIYRMKNKSSKNRTMKKRSTAMCYETTFGGLSKWFVHLYEEYGWMILAKHHGMMDKTMVYKSSLKRFLCSAEKKMRSSISSEHKNDLKIMHEHIYLLSEHADKHL